MNSQAICTSFKVDVLNGVHNFGTAPIRSTTTADTFKAALYQATQGPGISATTAAYTTSGEVAAGYGAVGYTPGGVTVQNANLPASGSGEAYWTPSANLSWGFISIPQPFDSVLIYNASQGNKAVAVYTFGAQTIAYGILTLTMPSNGPVTALLSIG